MGKYLRIILALALFACSNSSNKKEEATIEETHTATAQTPILGQEITTPTGLKYIDEVLGTGNTPKIGDKVNVHYTGTLEDGTKFDSSHDRNQPFEFTLGIGRVIKGWDEGVATMKEGGKRKLIIPPHLGYGEKGAGDVIPPGSTLHFDVELIEVLEKFVDTDFSLPGKEEVTETGLRMIIHKDGNGKKPKVGQTVTVHYTGMLADGSQFDSSHNRGQPFKFPLGQGRVIKGWEEAITLLNVGSKAKFIIPSDLAYGPRGRPGIPPNATLIFEIELVGIQQGHEHDHSDPNHTH